MTCLSGSGTGYAEVYINDRLHSSEMITFS
jgi:hypothetical protein